MSKKRIDFKKAQDLYDEFQSWDKVSKDMKCGIATMFKYVRLGILKTNREKLRAYKIDIDSIQKDYDCGMSLNDLEEKYKIPQMKMLRYGLKTRNRSDARVNTHKIKGVSEKTRKKLSEAAKRNNFGGYKPHPNRGERYNGIWFDSKWEVRVAKSLDDNKIKWVRPRIGFVWNIEGNKYYPDFYLPDFDVYLDPKNPYLQKIDRLKIENAIKINNIKVIVLNEGQLEWDTIYACLVQN